MLVVLLVAAAHGALTKNEAWCRDLGEALAAARCVEPSLSIEAARRLVAAAGVPTAVAPSEAARRVSAHLASDDARRRRHDAVVRLIADQCRGRVRVDTPLALVDNASLLSRKSRRVDLVVDESVFVEVTVLAAASQAVFDHAIAEKKRKYDDLPTPPVVVAVHAVLGEIVPPAALEDLVAALGIDNKEDYLAEAIRTTIVSLAATPLLELSSVLPDARRRSVLHVRRNNNNVKRWRKRRRSPPPRKT